MMMAEAPQDLEDMSVRDVKGLIWDILVKHGPWTALAVLLLASLLGWIPGPTTDLLLRHERESGDRINAVISALNYDAALLRAICINIANGNKDQIAHCQPIFVKEYEFKQ